MSIPSPLLLLTPDRSRDPDGVVAPVLNGPVRTNAGQWVLEEGTTNLVPNPSFQHATLMTGWSLQGVTTTADTVNPVSGTQSLKITNGAAALGVFTVSGSTAPERIIVTPGTVYTVSWSMRAGIAGRSTRAAVVWRTAAGATISTVQSPVVALTTNWQRLTYTPAAAPATAAYCYIIIYTNMTGWAAGDDYWVDAVQFEAKPYATSYADGSLGTGYGWTGTANASTSTRAAGSIAAPLGSFGALYIRHDGTSSTLAGPGTFGLSGNAAYSAGTLTVSSTRTTTVEAILGFDRELTAEELAELDAMPTSALGRLFIGTPVTPAYLSGLNGFETAVYLTDRDNSTRVDVTDYIEDLSVDADIDRPGAKSHVTVKAHQDVLRDGQWIAPFQMITPETGDPITRQMGHFRLTTPGVGFRGTDAVHVDATGADIVDDIVAARLGETFYTPVDGNPMEDVRHLIRLATMGVRGPNLITNNSFEQDGTGWISSISSGAGVIQYGAFPQTPAPEGEKVFSALFNDGVAANLHISARQTVTVPVAAQYMYFSGLSWLVSGAHRCVLHVIWRDANDLQVGSPIEILRPDVPYQSWVRHFAVLPVPESAVLAWVYVRVWTTTTITGQSRSMWDDVQAGEAYGLPIPDSRIVLPRSWVKATARIQTMVGKSIGYDAINADRLTGLGMAALHTLFDGRLTTTPSRNPANATAKRTYGIGDYELVGMVEIQRSATNRYNHVIARMEDFTDAANSMAVEVFNNDPDDEWSIRRMGRVESREIVVQDVESEEKLREIAQVHLDRASMQEELTIRVLADPELAVHDVIEITGEPGHAAVGKWAIENIRWGMRADDPLVTLSARRTIKRGAA